MRSLIDGQVLTTIPAGTASDAQRAIAAARKKVLLKWADLIEAQAVAIANSTEYGLAAGVWTNDLGRAHRMIRAIRSGVVHVNCYGGADITVPLGGVKQSGNGHEKSLHAFDKYLDLKTAWIQL